MSGTSEEEVLFRARTERMPSSQTEVGVTLRASAAPGPTADVDPAELPRITLDTRQASPIPPDRSHRADLAIVTTLGEGGMGRVHLARQRSLARDVAVKTLKEGATSAVAHALLREARVTGLLEHPGVIPVHALGLDEHGRPMLVMKRVDGVDLATQLGGKPQSGERLVAHLETLMQVCRTCEFAHDRGVLHRDIKPENIMVGGFGEVYLLDWGIATKLEPKAGGASQDEPIVGTPVYMAPEMVLGRPLDARTDVYLLGATLHEIITGVPRHGGKSMMEVARAAMLSEPYAYGPDVPEELARLCNRATAKQPADRPASAAAFREELASFLRHRAARAIAEAALERLVELEALLSAADGPPKDLSRAYRLVAEARFGLTQSLREDAAEHAARSGMRRCVVAAIELELRQGHVESASALLRELEAPDAALEARIAERRAEDERNARERARLERIEHDLDPTQHARRRTIPLVIAAVILAGIGLYLTFGSPSVTPRSMVVAASLAMLVIVGGAIALWRSVLTNAFNRRAALLLVLSVGAALANRVLGLLVDRPPAQTLALDLLLLTVIVTSAVNTMLRALWPSAVILAIGLVAVLVFPEHAAHIFTFSTFLNLVVGAIVLERVRRQ